MQSDDLNKRRAGDETFLGVRKAKLENLPSDVRGVVIAALIEADEAARSGDPKREAEATEKVRKAVGAVEDHNAGQIVEKFFLESLKPVHGDHKVIRKFARRAGVES